MSWFQWGEERVVSPDSTIKLVRCPDCPSTSLVPLSEMTRHIGVLHRGEGFRCAVCKVRIDLSNTYYSVQHPHYFSSPASSRTFCPSIRLKST